MWAQEYSVRINWKIFEENTSTKESLYEFANRDYGFCEFKENCWPDECKKEVGRMRRIGLQRARKLAKEALRRMGI